MSPSHVAYTPLPCTWTTVLHILLHVCGTVYHWIFISQILGHFFVINLKHICSHLLTLHNLNLSLNSVFTRWCPQLSMKHCVHSVISTTQSETVCSLGDLWNSVWRDLLARLEKSLRVLQSRVCSRNLGSEFRAPPPPPSHRFWHYIISKFNINYRPSRKQLRVEIDTPFPKMAWKS